VRILWRSGAQCDQFRRLIEKVPFNAIHARAAGRIELSNDGAARIEDFDLWRSLGRRL
jgi:predicted nucleic acid-binding protein